MANETDSLTIVELFQSQGCNSCPPANANLINLSSCPASQAIVPLPPNSNYLLLTYHVTYWDYLGWKDVFGNSAFDIRQREYVERMSLQSAFTPQVIVNGRASGVGNTESGLKQVLRQGGAGSALPITVSAIQNDNDRDIIISISSPRSLTSRDLKVNLVWYDPTVRDVKIPRGENAGRKLPHLNVVKSLEHIGNVSSGEERCFSIEKRSDGLQGVILVQDGPGGHILGASRI